MSTDRSSNSSEIPAMRKLKKKKIKKQMASDRAILEEEEKQVDESDSYNSPIQASEQNTNTNKINKDKTQKLADREAYLRRPPN